MADIVYATFDRFPAPKGNAVHVAAFVRGLAAAFGPVDLVTAEPADAGPRPGSGRMPPYLLAPDVVHHPLPAEGGNLIERALNFRAHLASWWRGRRAEVIHVRSIFEGYPIARRKDDLGARLVFEVNGLPSIELKYHYPPVADDRELLGKLTAQEQACLDAADLVVTVSRVTAGYLAARGVDPDRLRVIPNGVDPDVFPHLRPRPWAGRTVRLLYAGTLASWQGVAIALEALALYRREAPATLTLVGPSRPRQRREIHERCWELGVANAVELLDPVTQTELAGLHHASDVVVAPLTPDDRNLVQGCCPLKVLEAMASGTPLIASDLPVVRELAEPDVEALLVRPGSAKAIKDALLRLRDQPELGPRLSEAARRRVDRDGTWGRAQRSLAAAYEEVLSTALPKSGSAWSRAL